MKLRIRGNSIRLRLTRSEVAIIGESGRVAEVMIFAPDKTFTYALEVASVENLQATYTNDVMLIRVPAEAAKAWAHSEEVGLQTTQTVNENIELTVIVEKDFACLSPRGEEDADTFAHPQTGQTKC